MSVAKNSTRPALPLLPAVALAVVLTLGLSACGDSDAPLATEGAPPPPEVGVLTVQLSSIGLVTELPGRVEASRVAQVRARTAGILQKRLFREGSDVKPGQVLFEIDPEPNRALVAAASAAVARAEASLLQARTQADRFKPLVEAYAISQQDFDNAVAAQQLAEAELAASRAALQTANINLGHATVTAPIAGRIGRALVTEGALVGQGEATELAVVQQIDPIYVNFTQPVGEVLRLRAGMSRGGEPGQGSATAVRVIVDDADIEPFTGRLLFSDLSVDPGTGQVTLRAELPNPRGLLLPGMFVRVRLQQSSADDAVLLPQQAVQRGSQGDSVMIVGANGSVDSRKVRVGGARNGHWLILEGLQAGEQVVVDGFQRIRPGAAVKPVPWVAPAAPANGSATAVRKP